MIEKEYISAQGLLIDSFNLAKQILDSDFKPDFIVGIWRGGAPVGIAVQEFLSYHDIETDHIAIRTSGYDGIDSLKQEIKVHGLGYVVENANANDNLLLVDDIYDRGLSIKAVIEKLKEKMRKNFPKNIKVATVYFKPERNETKREPDFFVHKTDKWIIFPHELDGLTKEEIKKKGKDVAKLFTS